MPSFRALFRHSRALMPSFPRRREPPPVSACPRPLPSFPRRREPRPYLRPTKNPVPQGTGLPAVPPYFPTPVKAQGTLRSARSALPPSLTGGEPGQAYFPAARVRRGVSAGGSGGIFVRGGAPTFHRRRLAASPLPRLLVSVEAVALSIPRLALRRQRVARVAKTHPAPDALQQQLELQPRLVAG